MKKYSFLLLVFTLLLGFSSCVDNVIDEPPVKGAPVLETNATVADLKSKLTLGQITEITEDWVLDAIIVADDESGNFYKNVIIQDETGGIAVRIEANNLYTILPVGREVYIRAKGLFIGDYNGLPQIGYANDNGNLLTIPFPFVDSESDDALIVPARRDQAVVAKVTTLAALTQADINTLVKFEEVQFSEGELGETYADVVEEQSANRSLEDCNSNSAIVRTSGFADFAGTSVQEGNGSLTAIYSVFGTTDQLVIRDLNDLQLNSTRCDDPGNPNAPTPNATIADVMALYSEGVVTTITTDLIFDAVVTADDETGNFYKQIVVEDETGAINIQLDAFDLFQDFPLGRTVVVSTKGLAVGDYNGLPQIGIESTPGEISRISENLVSTTVYKSTSGSDLPGTPRSINDLSASDYNKLIVLSDVEFISSSLGMTYADAATQFALNHEVLDCDGNSVIMRTSGFADFADFTLPEGNGTIKGILSVFQGTKQLVVRKPQDVNFTGERCDGSGGGPGDAVEELMIDFESQAAGVDVNITDWSNEATKGVRKWRTKEFDDNVYVQATAYNDTETEMETYLITPQIIMNGSNTLSFRSAMAFFKHDGLTVQISSNYSEDPSAATWETLSATLAGSGNSDYDWVESGTIDLSGYSGKVHIAFKYNGTGASNTTTFIVDDVVVTK